MPFGMGVCMNRKVVPSVQQIPGVIEVTFEYNENSSKEKWVLIVYADSSQKVIECLSNNFSDFEFDRYNIDNETVKFQVYLSTGDKPCREFKGPQKELSSFS